jgi:hypothetical protein
MQRLSVAEIISPDLAREIREYMRELLVKKEKSLTL